MLASRYFTYQNIKNICWCLLQVCSVFFRFSATLINEISRYKIRNFHVCSSSLGVLQATGTGLCSGNESLNFQFSYFESRPYFMHWDYKGSSCIPDEKNKSKSKDFVRP